MTQKGPMWIHFIFVLDLSRAISLRPANQELFFWETFILIFMFQLSLAIKIWYWKHEVKTTIITAAEGTHPSSLWWEQCTYDILQDKGYISVSVHEQIFEASQVAVKMFQDSWNWSLVASLAEYAWHAMGKSRPENWIFRKNTLKIMYAKHQHMANPLKK